MTTTKCGMSQSKKYPREIINAIPELILFDLMLVQRRSGLCNTHVFKLFFGLFVEPPIGGIYIDPSPESV